MFCPWARKVVFAVGPVTGAVAGALLAGALLGGVVGPVMGAVAGAELGGGVGPVTGPLATVPFELQAVASSAAQTTPAQPATRRALRTLVVNMEIKPSQLSRFSTDNGKRVKGGG
jgi:hypothetical protein